MNNIENNNNALTNNTSLNKRPLNNINNKLDLKNIENNLEDKELENIKLDIFNCKKTTNRNDIGNKKRFIRNFLFMNYIKELCILRYINFSIATYSF